MLKLQKNISLLDYIWFVLFLFLETKPTSLIRMISPIETGEKSRDWAFKLQSYGFVGFFFFFLTQHLCFLSTQYLNYDKGY